MPLTAWRVRGPAQAPAPAPGQTINSSSVTEMRAESRLEAKSGSDPDCIHQRIAFSRRGEPLPSLHSRVDVTSSIVVLFSHCSEFSWGSLDRIITWDRFAEEFECFPLRFLRGTIGHPLESIKDKFKPNLLSIRHGDSFCAIWRLIGWTFDSCHLSGGWHRYA